MSRKFKVAIGLLASSADPASGASGDLYYNTDIKDLKAYDGSTWVEVGAKAIDGGAPDSTYGGTQAFDGGGVN